MTDFVTETMKLGWAMARLGYEAQTVVTLRLFGLAGAWALPPGEAQRMVAEKTPAWTDAWWQAATALSRGASSSAALAAALGPLHSGARANRRRLTARRRRR
ncbi:hypothetical protein OB2597_07055 [Pseudooceanicola batsensis HTCC2597]|uniref:Antifreeze protein n=1 Tax=Pseudooceanicola batsensis (strain ATCC BAA-863 / DSM 15984 / KCTC 12145 / HTCC2597) TaxID=252305 RepID=A3TTP6_PSEBH|nr:hypothetical protein [Pseudooceanicola batsensis]EAQ05023.1 hypothetical protein OB2597_07055 [Pseudooceanicola batsensis HTCC2597]